MIGGEGGSRVLEVIASPWLYSKWEVTLVCVEQRTDEVGLKKVNSNSGDCVESRL